MIRIFKHYIPKSLIWLSLSEVIGAALAVYLGLLFRFGTISNIEDVAVIWPRALVFALVVFSCFTAMGLYQRHMRDGLRGMFFRLLAALASAFALMGLLFYIFPELFLGRGAFAWSAAVTVVLVVVSRLLFIKLVHRESWQKRILILGAGSKASIIEKRLKRKTDRRGFHIVGYVSLPEESQQIPDSLIVKPETALVDYCKEHDIDELVVAITDRRKHFPVDELLDCKLSGIEVVELQTFFERQAGRVLLEILNPSWMIFSDGFTHGFMRDFVKRVFDLVASVALLIPVLPIMLITAVLVKLEDRGPVFYKQVRVGRNWRLFQVYKFRSMRVDAEKHGAQFAQKNDDRVTRIGRFIRKTRIDELPQLFNVLSGDMSFVGPRPERPQFVEEFSRSIPHYSERHRVKPGVTGWAQICYPYGSTEKDTVEKLQFDLYYVKNYSIFLDLTVLFQTAEVILWGKGAR
ncbi:MAG: TIGR03013 family PEP-CTERM/XrtA system glycosyltransferase [Gammaproteobacteria bacterium]|nr:TIGR03013 family PEP-CTERM/XrtA system glycosyltransferase [Gammaproteobacteria bacterium]